MILVATVFLNECISNKEDIRLFVDLCFFVVALFHFWSQLFNHLTHFVHLHTQMFFGEVLFTGRMAKAS